MNLQNIETIVLANIKHTRYSELSTSTDTEQVADFALLHKCVHMAREEIRLNCNISGVIKFAHGIITIAGQNSYTIPETDFDIPIGIFNYSLTGAIIGRLTKINLRNILDRIGTTDVPSDPPSSYMMDSATVAGLSVVMLFPTPQNGGDIILPVYKPVLTELTTSTDEDIIMKKYFMTVIKIATAFAFQIIKADNANFGVWITIGRTDFKDINIRETSFDMDNDIKTQTLLAIKRGQRYTI